MKLRKAKIKDIPDMIRLKNEIISLHLKFDRTYYQVKRNIEKIVSSDFKKIIYSKDKIIYVAEDKHRIIGYVSGSIDKRQPIFLIEKMGFLGTAIVTKKYKNKSVGQKLMNKLEKWFKDKKIKYIELGVDHRNKDGISVWKKFGFKNHRLIMKKSL